MATRDEAIKILTDGQKALANAKTKEETLDVLRNAGAIGYKPVFRCLVMGLTPENSVRF